MPYNQEHMLLQWGGSFADSASTPATDQFVGTLRFAGPGLNDQDNQATCDKMATALSAWWRGADKHFIPYNARLGWVKWNRIGTNGRYKSTQQTTLFTYPTSVVTANGAAYPQQVSFCTSWLTTVARGKASHGRTYWPTMVPIDATIGQRVVPANATAMAAAGIQLIRRLTVAANTAPTQNLPAYDPTIAIPTLANEGTGLRAAIMSPLGEGVTAYITRCRVGNRLDIQRSRDSDTEETYVSAGF